MDLSGYTSAVHAVIDPGESRVLKRRHRLAYAYRAEYSWLWITLLFISLALVVAARVTGWGWLIYPFMAVGVFLLISISAIVVMRGSILIAEDGVVLTGLVARRYIAFRDLSIEAARWPRVVIRDGDATFHLGWNGGPWSSFDDFVHQLRVGVVDAANVGDRWSEDSPAVPMDSAAMQHLMTLRNVGAASFERVLAARELARRGIDAVPLRREAEARWADPKVLVALGAIT
jgi:hypothetical protein